MDQERFAELTKSLVTTSPRRRLLAALGGGALGAVLGRTAVVEDAAAKKRKNRCKKKNRICQPFKSGQCCSKRCCPALGPEANTKSVCAPDNASQCCDPEDGGGYCKKVNGVAYRKCCPTSTNQPNGYCCRTSGSVCCEANSVQENDYCCPPDSECFDGLEGCRPIQNGLRASAVAAPKPEPMQSKGR